MSEKKRSWFKRKAPTTGPKQDASGVSSNIRGSPAVAAGGDPGKASFETREFSLMVHGVDFSDLDLVINPEYFPEVKPQDILEMSVQGTTALGAIMLVKSVAPVKGNLSISLSASMAELFRLHRGAVVTVKFADPATVGLHRATVSFKDYMPRSEMWRLKAEAIGRCLYHGKTLSLANVNVHVKDLIGATGDVLCGLVTDATKLVFRSKSAHVTVLLQLSSEMWDFADDGDLHMERAVRFLRVMMEKWRHTGVTHSVTVVLFTRTTIQRVNSGATTPDLQALPSEDFYQAVYSSVTVSDWTSLLPVIKAELEAFPQKARWGVRPLLDTESWSEERTPCCSRSGNLLEAVNLALDAYGLQYIDRDPHHVCNHVIVVTAGTSTFDVDGGLASITKRRMNDMGCSCDMVTVSHRPMHHAPLFVVLPPSRALDPRNRRISGNSTACGPLPVHVPERLDGKPFALGPAQHVTSVAARYKTPQWLMGQYFTDGPSSLRKHNEFKALSRAQVFAREGCRFSERGCTVPVALLVALQRLGCAPAAIHRTVLVQKDDISLLSIQSASSTLPKTLSNSTLKLSSSQSSIDCDGGEEQYPWRHVLQHHRQPSWPEIRVPVRAHALPDPVSIPIATSACADSGSGQPSSSPMLFPSHSLGSGSLLRVPSGPVSYSQPVIWRTPEHIAQRHRDHDRRVFNRTTGVVPSSVAIERYAQVRPRRPISSSTLHSESGVLSQVREASQRLSETEIETVAIGGTPILSQPSASPRFPPRHGRNPSISPKAAQTQASSFRRESQPEPAAHMVSPISGFQQYVDIAAGLPPPIMLTPPVKEGSVVQFRDRKESFGAVASAALDPETGETSETQDAPVSRVMFNPFQATFPTKMRWTFDRRRWAHVYMKTQSSISDMSEPARLEPVGIQELNWSSLTEPAVLPLTTDFLPPPNLLSEAYSSIPQYNLFLHPASASVTGKGSGVHAHKTTKSRDLPSLPRRRWLFDASPAHDGLGTLGPGVEDAVVRMVCQRLDHEFQVVDMKFASRDGYPWMKDLSGKPLCAVSSAHRIHVVIHQEPDVMEVKRYHKKPGEASVTDLACLSEFLVWDPVTQTAVATSRTFSVFPKDFTHLKRELNWNTLDQVACDPEEYRSSCESLDEDYVRYNQMWFIVFPSNFGVQSRSHASSNAATTVDEIPSGDVTVTPVDKGESADGPAVASVASVKSSQTMVTGSPSTSGMLPVIQFMDAILLRHGSRIGPLPVVVSESGGGDSPSVHNVRLDVKSKTGSSECIEMEYPTTYHPGLVYGLRLKWLACGAVVEDIKSMFLRTAKRLGHVTVVQVPTVSRYGLTAADLDTHMAWCWQRPSRCNSVLLATSFGPALLDACQRGDGSVLPTPVMAKFESGMVGSLGLVPDVFHRGKLTARMLLPKTEGVLPIQSVCDPDDLAQAEAEETGVKLLPFALVKHGWYRQYVHPSSGYCVRIDADGVVLIPCVNVAGSVLRDVCAVLAGVCCA